MTPRLPLPALGLLGALGVLGAAAPAASAAPSGTVVYIADGDVWRVAPDGTDRKALTTDGDKTNPYARPRLTADGIVWALKGRDVVKLSYDGAKLATLKVTPPKDSEGIATDIDPEFFDVSPDGTKLSYGIENIRCTAEDCNMDGITAILGTDGKTLEEEVFFSEATFVGNDTMVGNEGKWEREVRTLALGGGPNALWYRDGIDVHATQPGVTREPDVSPDRTRLAALRTISGGVHVATYNLKPGGAGLGTPEHACFWNDTIATGASPSWSPDSQEIAVAAKSGLGIATFAGGHTNGSCEKATIRTIAPAGASQPDWGAYPAPTPPPPPPPPPADTGGGGGGQPPVTQPQPGTQPGPVTPQPVVTASKAKLSIVASQKLKTVLKKGLRVKVSGAAAGKLAVVVRERGKVVGRGTVTVPAGGTAELSVQLSKAAAKKLKKARSAVFMAAAGELSAAAKVKR